MIKRMKMTVL